MKPASLFRLASAFPISVAALLVCGSPIYGQRPAGPRTGPRMARAAVTSNLAPDQRSAAAIPLAQAAGTFLTFDAGPCQTPPSFPGCTDPVAINNAGDVLGYSVDADGLPHGFLRDKSGTFTMFDVPGAVAYSLVFSEGPPGSSLSPSGQATGGYYDANGNQHGFVRDHHGAIATFDAPGAVNGTIPLSINAAGEVTGYFFDAGFFGHGFLRDAHGTVTAFDAPGAGTVANACFLGLTYPQGINAGGKIAGFYYDPQCNVHGFLRDRNGTFSVVDVPNSADTFPATINDGGEIAGSVFGAAGGNAFIRDQNGSFTVFNVPGVRDFGSMEINAPGVVAGSYLDANLVSHGFRRTADGTLTTIDVPGAGTGFLEGTYANSINAAGVIAGSYFDANGFQHGFLFLPK